MTKAAGAKPSKEQNKNKMVGPPGVLCLPTGQQPLTEGGRRQRIRELNDQLRTTGRGGMVLVTNGIAMLGSGGRAILDAVQEFHDFNPDNDLGGEHDCASLEVNGRRVIWKIDALDRRREFASPDPADPKVTVRVLSVMLASEY